MKAEIITIGDEILIGQIIDTNSSWLGQELSMLGIQVVHRTSVSDQQDKITKALHDAGLRADIMILTGGLGPTKDDITKATLAEFFQVKMKLNEEVLNWVTKIFTTRKLPMIESNKLQAMVPENCEILFNKNGTAPGMWFQESGKIYISLPGVPFEMKSIFSEYVIPKLKLLLQLPAIIHRTIQTTSIGESFLAKKIAAWENDLPAYIKLAYLPSVGQVRLRLSGTHCNREMLTKEIQNRIDDLYGIAGEYIFGEEEDSLPLVVGNLLKKDQLSLSTAESCTGGYIAHLITSIPGSSNYFKGSIVSYANEIKIAELSVSKQVISDEGAVSENCVRQMAEGIRKKYRTDFSIATSGIAGPDGGTPEKPVGTVWIAVSSETKTIARLFNMGDSRERTIHRTALQSLDMLRLMLLNRS